MMTADQLRQRCYALRKGEMHCDDELVTEIEADLEEYRLAKVEQTPPDYLAGLLPLMGWLIYEVTWDCVRLMTDVRREAGTEAAEANRLRHELIARATNAARTMPWPEYAIRALGAFRAQALAESKTDTEEGYVRAQIVHLEGRGRHTEFLSYHRDTGETDPYRRALDEMLVQLVLAETGTACRTAELVIGRWAETTHGLGETEAVRRGAERSQSMFEQLSSGVDIGEQALAAATRVKQNHGFVDEPGEESLAVHTWFINPGVMTARAILLMLALYPEMERLGRYPLGEDDTWEQTRLRLRDRFDAAYKYIEMPIIDSKGRQLEPRDDVKLAIVQLRLNAALVMPGHRLPSSMTFARCLSHEVLDGEAAEALSGWLTEKVTDKNGVEKQRSRHRGFGTATMPDFIGGVEACRAAFGAEPGFARWRARWFLLDSYANEPGRVQRVEKALGYPVSTVRPI